MAEDSVNFSSEAEFHRKMWLALAPLEVVEEHENITDESPSFCDDPTTSIDFSDFSSSEAEFRRKARLALAPLYEATTPNSNCTENNMMEDNDTVEIVGDSETETDHDIVTASKVDTCKNGDPQSVLVIMILGRKSVS